MSIPSSGRRALAKPTTPESLRGGHFGHAFISRDCWGRCDKRAQKNAPYRAKHPYTGATTLFRRRAPVSRRPTTP